MRGSCSPTRVDLRVVILEQAATLCFIGHAPAEYWRGLIVQADATMASRRAEREAGLVVIERHDLASDRRLTLVTDKDSLSVCA